MSGRSLERIVFQYTEREEEEGEWVVVKPVIFEFTLAMYDLIKGGYLLFEMRFNY